MFKREAEWIGQKLADVDDLAPVLNIGSSTERFRTQVQPWIDQLLFAPLRARDAEIVHVDLKAAPGVDLQADLLTAEGFACLKAVKPKTVLLCNILEHVLDPELMTQRSFELLQPGGRLIVSVPRSYPHHNDPIDTMFRPEPEQVAGFVPEAAMTAGEVVATEYHWHEIARNPRKAMIERVKWLFVPYQVTLLVLERREPAVRGLVDAA